MNTIKKLENGFEIEALGFGTWGVGGLFSSYLPNPDSKNNYDEASDIEAIRKAIELGVSRFDTAEMYADGYSENTRKSFGRLRKVKAFCNFKGKSSKPWVRRCYKFM